MKGTRLIGITGGIGSGKSVVSRILRLQGWPVYDCDREARRLMEESEDFLCDLVSRIGEDALTLQRRLNRPLIAERVFADPEALEWLNSRVHAMVRQDIQAVGYGSQSKWLFVESAILASSGLAQMCHGILLVESPRELRVGRAMRRSGLGRSQVESRLEAQEQEGRLLRQFPCVTVLNDGSVPLMPQLSRFLEEIS